jgi:hydroxypyruvate isomerase
MPRFAANLSMLFTEVPFLQRFALAAHHGFSAVECQFPYDWCAEELRDLLQQHHLQMVLHNLPAGSWMAGERGIACHPGRVDEFRDGVLTAVAYAKCLGVKQLNCLAGKAPSDTDHATCTATLVSNLRYAARVLAAEGLKLLLEPINRWDVPGFLVYTTAHALAILDAVGADNAYVQYDIYHAQRMEGNLTLTLQQHLHRIGHIQLADNPGRHEPGTGEINFTYLLPALDQMGYSGWVGCEYTPAAGTVAGLGWMRAQTTA